ncbi:C-type mannose receptor 2 [Mactra antiquata]
MFSAFHCHHYDGQYRTVRLSDGELFTYRFVRANLTATMAQEDCVKTGGSLAKLSTVSKLDLVYQVMGCAGFGRFTYFIDGRRDNKTLAWKWSDGELIPMNSTFWHPGFPNTHNEDCAIVRVRPFRTLDDCGCDVALPYICEKNLLPTPFSCHPNDGQYRTATLSDGDLFTYRFVSTAPLSENKAQADCEKTGGSLAKLSTVPKLDFVYQLMNCSGIRQYVYFINGRRDNKTLAWKWSDGELIPMNSTFWHPGFPNTHNEDCAIVRVRPFRTFDDFGCGIRQPYLCEKTLLSIPSFCHPDDDQYRTVRLSDGELFTYRFVRKRLTAHMAQVVCGKNGGSLVKLSTMPKRNFIYQLLNCPGDVFEQAFYYVGGNNNNTALTWKWSDGEKIPMNYVWWHPGYPNVPNDGHCLKISELKY